MPSDLFVAWIEANLRAHGIDKVIPSAEMIEQRARQVLGLKHVKQAAQKWNKRPPGTEPKSSCRLTSLG